VDRVYAGNAQLTPAGALRKGTSAAPPPPSPTSCVARKKPESAVSCAAVLAKSQLSTVLASDSAGLRAAAAAAPPCPCLCSAAAPGVSTPLFHDKNTQHVGKSQSERPHTIWKRPRTELRQRAHGELEHPEQLATLLEGGARAGVELPGEACVRTDAPHQTWPYVVMMRVCSTQMMGCVRTRHIHVHRARSHSARSQHPGER
jgi:hypothetical protein